MGGRGGSSGLSQNRIGSELEKIRNATKENLRVFDSNGNLIYLEGGTKGHTGYSTIDYEGKIIAHNHPKGYAPYPSGTDFDTFQRHNAKEMIIVSKDYTVSVRKDPSFKSISGIRESISYAAHMMGERDVLTQSRKDVREKKISAQQANEKILDFYKKVAKRAGYIMEVRKKK